MNRSLLQRVNLLNFNCTKLNNDIRGKLNINKIQNYTSLSYPSKSINVHCYKPRQLRVCIQRKEISTSIRRTAMFNVQDEAEFQEKVMKSDIPVVVDFYANWCGPCKLLGPRLERIIGGKGEKLHLAKINIDNVSDLALEYGVSAVPSVLAIKNGEVVDKFVGLQEETRINAFVNKLIGE